MLEFLQGFAYGLFVTCLPWFLIGMASPRHALATPLPDRLQVIVRYWLLVPFIAFVLWLTSLWGGFGPSLLGWLAGLAAIAIELPLERRLRRWWGARKQRRREAQRHAEAAQKQARQAREASETGMFTLDPERPPAGADEVVLALCVAKQRLVDARQPEIAVQADRLYSRYRHAMQVLLARFDASELAFERSRTLVAEVCFTAVDNLTVMASQASGIAGVDAEFVRRRLAEEHERLTVAERVALKRRLALVEETEHHLRDLSARNEAALTALDDAAVAMARIETGRPQASVSAEQALKDLRHFVGRAERYGRDR
ncbi:hypothetical protein SAMN05661010_01239 [Modicisalibacter muralis]|uniref:Cobyrinic acid a,c-diamide synthase n=1 Tax=Modicisalibacter muralis TaxID=119000 RepID=A0A1G9ILU0_9GAMM|nr:cobyrinic acid a,c-diamide synthase [Halomonas muralis]SDL25844.1 hypothetical protein SAMN05661010_01239 [Halomonas muralis]